MSTKYRLAATARAEALKTWHGAVMGLESNLGPIIGHFPGGKPEGFDYGGGAL